MPDTALVAARRAADVRNDRLVLLRGAAIVSAGYGVGASLQAVYVYSRVLPSLGAVPIWWRLAANAVAVVALVGTLWALRVYRYRTAWPMIGGAAAAALVSAVLRWCAQVAFGIAAAGDTDTRDAELLGGFIVAGISVAIALWSLYSRRVARGAIRSSERRAVHVESTLHMLEQEEIRVRREVAEGLHGTLQNKLVVVVARLDEVLDQPLDLREQDVATLRWMRAELDDVRELDVRQMSRLLYPERLELGLVPAVRALLGRLPSTIATRLVVTDDVRELDDPASNRITVGTRLLAVRVVEEGITNALKHGPATTVAVTVGVEDGRLVVGVENDVPLELGAGPRDDSGIARLRERVALADGTLELGPGDPADVRLELRVPLPAMETAR
ncbi:sensor histidine kinase [Cellulomonas sp. HZM]|uniref:sensor histidine kinase n=1 Tax=Cellulomonas sp. HZM TaxID=1454010 RepID=UPI00049336BF|nr:ATP-binding protein [Cellulomonas sp. HZM]